MKEKVGVGVIGTGFARRVQIPGFGSCKNAEVVSVSSGHVENARSTAEEFGIPHFTDDWRQTAGHKDVDIVCITTPPNMHREMTLFAINQGKHVLCEKPMAMNVAETEEMLAAAMSSEVMALIDHELRFLPGRQRAYKMLRDGAIGKVRHAKYNFRAPHRGDPDAPWNWWSDVKQGGGALGAINSHVIDSFQWLLSTDILSVYSQLQTHIKQRRDDSGQVREVTTDDEANMVLRFADSELTQDATGLVSVSMVEQPEYQNRLEFFGTEGAMRIDHRGELFIASNGDEKWTPIEVDLGTTVEGIPDTGFARGFMAFAPRIIDAVSKDDLKVENAATFEDGVRVQRVLDAARESNSTGRVVKIQDVRFSSTAS